MSILKSHGGNADQCDRFTYTYDHPLAGEGFFLHTYMSDGDPLPSYEGEPALVDIKGDIDFLTEEIWSNLNEENKVSLFVRFVSLEDGSYVSRIVNKNQ